MGCDVSEWQAPGSVDFAAYEGIIIRASHGTTEDLHWRAHFNAVVAAGKPLGLYHFAEEAPTPIIQANYFRALVGFLKPAQARGGFWLDAEPTEAPAPWAGPDSGWVDTFRANVSLPWCGLYSNLSLFNGQLKAYSRFALNWLAWPLGTVLEPGWTVPTYILRQTGVVNGVDQDQMVAAQPYPGAWAA